MCEKKDLQFTCRECGSDQLAYQKYAKCMTPVSLLENSNIEYGQSIFDEAYYLCVDEGFICLNCESLVDHCGCLMETEKELIDYLTMDPQVREQQQQEHDECVDALSSEQEQKEIEQVNTSATMDIFEKMTINE